MDDIKLHPAEKSTRRVDFIYGMYDHVDIPDPTPTPVHTSTPTSSTTPTPSPTHTHTSTRSTTPTPSPTQTHTVTDTQTRTQTHTPTPTPTVTPTGTIFYSPITDIRHFANDEEITGQFADTVICKCSVSGLTSDTDNALFVVRKTDEEIPRSTLHVGALGVYKIISSIGTFTDKVLSGDGKTFSAVSYSCIDLIVPRMTEGNSTLEHLVILKKGNEYYVLSGGENVIVPPDGSVVVPDGDTTLVMDAPATLTVIGGYHMYENEESSITMYSVDDAVPDMGYTFDIHEYAYTFVCNITIHYGVFNVRTSFISRNDVILVYNDDKLVGISSIFNTDKINVQVYSNITSAQAYVFKIVKYESKKIIEIGTKVMSTGTSAVSFELGYIKKSLDGITWVSANVRSEDKKLGTYFKSVLDAMTEIKSQKGVVRKNNGYYVGNLDVTSPFPVYDVTYLQFYMVKTSSDVSWELYGKPLIDIDAEHTINVGENWVSSHMVNDVAFTDWIAQYPHVNKVTGHRGFMSLDDKGEWLGNIEFVKPNEGYIINSTKDYIIKKNIHQYENYSYITKDSHSFYISDPYIEGIFKSTTESTFEATLNGVSFYCAVVASDKKYHDSNIHTIVPTYFESAEAPDPLVVGDLKISKIKGVISYTIDKEKNTHLSGLLDMYVIVGDGDDFTGETPFTGWYSIYNHTEGLKIKKY